MVVFEWWCAWTLLSYLGVFPKLCVIETKIPWCLCVVIIGRSWWEKSSIKFLGRWELKSLDWHTCGWQDNKFRYPRCSDWKSCPNLSAYNEVTAVWKSGACVILINRWMKQKRSIDVSRCDGWSQGVGVSPCCQLLPLLPSSCPRAPCPCLLVYHFCLLGAGKLLHWACSNCRQVSKRSPSVSPVDRGDEQKGLDNFFSLLVVRAGLREAWLVICLLQSTDSVDDHAKPMLCLEKWNQRHTNSISGQNKICQNGRCVSLFLEERVWKCYFTYLRCLLDRKLKTMNLK